MPRHLPCSSLPGYVTATCSALFMAALASGCGDDSTTVVNDPDLDVRVTIDAARVDSGNRVEVSATAGAGARGARPLTFEWFAAGGRFSDDRAQETRWTAPEEVGVFSLGVVVSDGQRSGVGSADVTVDLYEPTDDPHYVGAETCAGCHATDEIGGDQHTAWAASAHADAISPLVERGVDENDFCLTCHTVGTYGLFADASLDNGGHDETKVERLEGVQCENCHGPGSEHPTVDFGSVDVSMDAAVCGSCHNGTHHPTFDEWESSAHAQVVGFAAPRTTCAKCHNGIEAPNYLDDPLGYTPPAENLSEVSSHTCAVCHDPHGNDNPGNLRDASVTDVILPNSVLVEEAGAGRLCMSCHNGRRQDFDVISQIDNGSSHFGPHRSVQGDMLKGVNAYEDLAPDFTFASSKHILIQDACVTCHLSPNDGDPANGIPTFTGHTFEPTVGACQQCHGPVTAFEDVTAKDDFDGDGTVEGVQDEVRGLAEILREAIVDASQSAEARQEFLDDFEHAVGDTSISTREQREAAYNLFFVEFDGSSGVHNATYSVQLLQQSILYLDSMAVPRAAAILTGEAVGS